MDTPNDINIYDNVDRADVLYAEFESRIKRLSAIGHFLRQEQWMYAEGEELECLVTTYLHLFALGTTTAHECVKRLNSVTPVLLANRMVMLGRHVRSLTGVCERLQLSSFDSRRFASFCGNEVLQRRLTLRRVIKDLRERLEIVMQDIRIKTSAEFLENQLMVFAESSYYRQRREQFGQEVEGRLIDTCMTEGKPKTAHEEYSAFMATLRTHDTYGPILAELPPKDATKEHVTAFLEKQINDIDIRGIGHWIDTLMTMSLNNENRTFGKLQLHAGDGTWDTQMPQATDKQMEDIVAEALRRTRENSHDWMYQYDYVWPLMYMQQNDQLPRFATMAAYLRFLNDRQLPKLPSSKTASKYYREPKGHYTTWRYEDDKGRKTREKTRRTKLVRAFCEAIAKAAKENRLKCPVPQADIDGETDEG